MQLPPKEVFIDEYLEGYMEFHAEEFEQMDIEEAEAAINQVQHFAGIRWEYISAQQTEKPGRKYSDEEIESYINSLD